jgi:AmmeMemoRadiSam system protein B
MTPTLKPKLRRSITGQLDPHDADFVWLFDSHRFSQQAVRLHRNAITILEQFNGEASLQDVQVNFAQAGFGFIPADVLNSIVAALDEALFLEGDRYQQQLARFMERPIRPAACLGTYPSEPDRIEQLVDSLFTAAGGAGLPDSTIGSDGSLRGALIPHIDYRRGNISYGWGFKEVIEKSPASLFVMIGTSHYSQQRYILTRKDFATPWGVAPTDQPFVERLALEYGQACFADEPAHFPEHSLELHLVILQLLLRRRERAFRIVPLLVGPFHDAIESGKEPETFDDIQRMIHALRSAEEECGEEVCYLVSGDLAHIGPKFGENDPVTGSQLDQSRQRDQLLLQAVAEGDRAGFHSLLHEEADSRRICGFPPLYTFLAAAEPSRGRVLHYQQYSHPQGFESVSFASIGFYR